MSIRALRTFLVVAKHGTFAAAARDVGLTQAAVSMQMKTLEGELRTRLFDRIGRAIVLNSAGRNLVPVATQIVNLYADLSLSVGDGELQGPLHIGAIPPTFAKLLPEALLILRSDYPRVDVRLISGVSDALATKVERGEIDAALVADSPEPLSRALVIHPVVREPLVLIGPKRMMATRARDVLTREPYIRLARDSWTGRFIEQTLRQHDINVRTAMDIDTPDGIAEMVARGFGVSIIPMYDGRWLYDDRLSIWRFTKPILDRGISLIERQAHNRTRLTSVLLQRLVDVSNANRRSVRLRRTVL